MGRWYLQNKGLGIHGHPEKDRIERFLTQEQVSAILQSVEASAQTFNKHWRRDHCGIYLGFMLGLRIGEACILERRHFEPLLHKSDTVRVPTLKQRQSTLLTCACGKKVRVRIDRAGERWPCPKCGKTSLVPVTQAKRIVKEQELPIVEQQVVAYIQDYLINHMRPDQQWLLESHRGEHVSESYLSRIFNTYLLQSGLSKKYSWHSLRHGRAVRLYRLFRDLVFVRDALRHKSMATTQGYAHMDPELQDDYRKALNSGALDPHAKTEEDGDGKTADSGAGEARA